MGGEETHEHRPLLPWHNIDFPDYVSPCALCDALLQLDPQSMLIKEITRDEFLELYADPNRPSSGEE